MGFSVYQMDPVRAKCETLIDFLRSYDLELNSTELQFLTKDNLQQFVSLYGLHYQPNFPILHSPTFYVLDSPPILLLAMACVGAAYSNGLFSEKEIILLARKILRAFDFQEVLLLDLVL